MRWATIGCAVDFSEQSQLAMLEAAELAAEAGATLVLVHVQSPAFGVGPARRPPGPASAEDAWELSPVASWRAEAERLLARPVEVHALPGLDPGAGIVAFAQERGVDLLVVGTRRRADLPGATFGSVAEFVVRHAPCPVLVVRPRSGGAQVAPAPQAARAVSATGGR